MITLLSKDLHYSQKERELFSFQLPSVANNCVLLHTCNRTELYQGNGRVPIDVARHLFRVVSGLESAFLGEAAIQGQVKAAYEKARDNSILSAGLHQLFQQALRIGKRVRTETKIASGAMSHGKAVLEVMRQEGFHLSGARVVIIGVNHLNQSLIKYLRERGSNTIFVANRTYEKALALADKFDCKAVRLEKLREKLRSTDLLISATSAPHLIVKKKDFPTARQILAFDLAVPRDIDPASAELPLVKLFAIEDIEKRIKGNLKKRRLEMKKAEKIIEEEIRTFYD